jgi:hypothetical protein
MLAFVALWPDPSLAVIAPVDMHTIGTLTLAILWPDLQPPERLEHVELPLGDATVIIWRGNLYRERRWILA